MLEHAIVVLPITTDHNSIQPSQKTFRTKRILAKAGRQNRYVETVDNYPFLHSTPPPSQISKISQLLTLTFYRPIPQWCRLKTDSKIQVCYLLPYASYLLSIAITVQRQASSLASHEAQYLISPFHLPTPLFLRAALMRTRHCL